MPMQPQRRLQVVCFPSPAVTVMLEGEGAVEQGALRQEFFEGVH